MTWSEARAEAHRILEHYYHSVFRSQTGHGGAQADWIANPDDVRKLTAFFGWTAWTATANRPGTHLLLHEQLASGTAGGQYDYGGGHHVERDFDYRPPGRDRARVLSVRSLRLVGLERCTHAGPFTPGRGGVGHASAENRGVVPPGFFLVISSPSVDRRAHRALSRGARRVFWF